MALKHPRAVKRAVWAWWWVGSFLVAPIVGGSLWGHTGAGVVMLAAFLVNGCIVAAYEYWYPPTRIP